MKFAAAAIALAIAYPLPAAAQQFPFTPSMQFECLRRAAPEEARLSAMHAWLEIDGTTPSADVTAQITAALDSCGKKHNWSDEQRSMAHDAMMYDTRKDELWDAIKVDIVIPSRVGSRLMYVEKKLLLDRNWRKDAALEAHVRSLFVARGVADEEAQRIGGDIVHALHNLINLIERWEAKWPTPEFKPPLPPAPPPPRAPAPPG